MEPVCPSKTLVSTTRLYCHNPKTTYEARCITWPWRCKERTLNLMIQLQIKILSPCIKLQQEFYLCFNVSYLVSLNKATTWHGRTSNSETCKMKHWQNKYHHHMVWERLKITTELLAFLLCVWETLGLILGSEACYPEIFAMAFFSISRKMLGQYLKLCCNHFHILSTSFTIIFPMMAL